METPNSLIKYQKIILDDLREMIPDDKSLFKMIQYHLGWLDKGFNQAETSPGKLSRPALTLLTAEAFGGEVAKVLPAATAIQIFHDFTLMHDDIEDGDPVRRHRETVWKVWGIPRAINAGDAMYTLNFKSLLRLTEKRDEVISLLLNSYLKIVAGQELDLSFVQKRVAEVSVENYFEMIEGKSAELIAASAQTGALLAGASGKDQEGIYNYGLNLGLGYQVYDDMVSIWGTTANSGKVELGDIVEKKKTLPLICLYDSVNEEDRKNLDLIYSAEKISAEKANEVKLMMENYGIKEKVKNKVKEFKASATEALSDLPIAEDFKEEYLSVLNWLIPEEEV
jgi:geranylgeranyl diphosphate synthase type I